VRNVSAYGTASVAQHTMMLMLALAMVTRINGQATMKETIPNFNTVIIR
jgi:lactate dehydrogenase-like 2-hydroxyacid dehydrogenase